MASRIGLFIIVFFLSFPHYADAQSMRIVSLYPGHTDNIVAIGGESKLIAISKNDDREMLPGLPRFSAKSSAEEILVLQPDIVLTRGLNERQNPHLRIVLEKAGVKVVSIDPPGWDGFEAYLIKIALLTGIDPAIALAKLNKTRNEIAAESAKKSGGRHPFVFVEATAKELNTCSPDSWAANLIRLAGGRNTAYDAKPIRSGSAIAPYGLERILKAAASGGMDIYLIQQGTMNSTDIKSMETRPWFTAIKKIKTSVIMEKNLSRPSLLGLKSGGMQLINIFYGE